MPGLSEQRNHECRQSDLVKKACPGVRRNQRADEQENNADKVALLFAHHAVLQKLNSAFAELPQVAPLRRPVQNHQQLLKVA